MADRLMADDKSANMFDFIRRLVKTAKRQAQNERMKVAYGCSVVISDNVFLIWYYLSPLNDIY